MVASHLWYKQNWESFNLLISILLSKCSCPLLVHPAYTERNLSFEIGGTKEYTVGGLLLSKPIVCRSFLLTQEVSTKYPHFPCSGPELPDAF